MRFFTLYNNIHGFKFLGPYAKFLLENHIDELCKEQYDLSIELQLPVMKLLTQFSREQLLEFTKASMTEYLTYLSQDRSLELAELSLDRWRRNQLGLIGKFELVAEDLTLINFVRGRSLRKFIQGYTNDVNVMMHLIEEIDSFLTGFNTASTNTYIQLLKEQVAHREKELLEAQRIANIGSFEWDVATNLSKNSTELNRIYELDEDVSFTDFLQFVHEEDRTKVSEFLQNAVIDGNYDFEFRFIRNGNTKHLHSKGIVVFDNKLPVKIIGTVQDITQNKIIEKALVEQSLALQTSNESLQQFAHVASHDLKEPARKISLLTDQVLRKEQNVSEASRALLEKMHHSSLRMLRMIDDIMDYSTITQWEEKQHCNLNEIVNEATEFLEQYIEEKKAVISVKDLPVISVIPSQMRQLFQNLIANALKFSKADVTPVVQIKYKRVPAAELAATTNLSTDCHQLSISDNGIGFDQQYSRQIFKLFSRLHNKNVYEGSGLGLAIVKRVVDHHNGFIDATSQAGEGATFTILLPIV